jgi:hypothetical protein
VVKAWERKTKTKKQTEKEKIASQQYAKITDLLVEGKKGAELELAFAEWERGKDQIPGSRQNSKHSVTARIVVVVVLSCFFALAHLPTPATPLH